MLISNKNKLINSFPIELKSDVEIVFDILIDKDFESNILDAAELIFNKQKLLIPARIYFNKPTEIIYQSLTTKQQTILDCIYSRHKDGFIRQKSLEQLVDKKDTFIIPFIFKLLGEYVLEILVVADKHINENNIEAYLDFFEENQQCRQYTECRMISYWNVFYRYKYNKLKDYLGYKIFKRIKVEEQKRRIKIK